MQWIVSSSVLILVVIALRYVLRGKLSLRMQYALWLLVLVRLLVPVSFGASDLSVYCRRSGAEHERGGPAGPRAERHDRDGDRADGRKDRLGADRKNRLARRRGGAGTV